MAYSPTTWVDGTTAITATQLNRIETGVDDAHDEAVAIRALFHSVAFDGDGTPQRMPSGWSVVRDEVGRYTVTHPLGTVSFGVVTGSERGGALHPSGTPPYAHTRNKGTTTFRVHVTDSGGTLVDCAVALIVFPFA